MTAQADLDAFRSLASVRVALIRTIDSGFSKMQPRLLPILRCPVTEEKLELEIIEETRVARVSGAETNALPGAAKDRNQCVLIDVLLDQQFSVLT